MTAIHTQTLTATHTPEYTPVVGVGEKEGYRKKSTTEERTRPGATGDVRGGGKAQKKRGRFKVQFEIARRIMKTCISEK